MTTLAYREGVLASDSRITAAETVITNNQRKVHRLKDGRLFGYAGSVEDGHRLLTALRRNTKPPELEAISALRIDPDGSVWLYEGNVWIKQREAYYALGSGSNYALGAMDAGVSAKDAVRIGIKRDVSSGGRVQAVTLR